MGKRAVSFLRRNERDLFYVAFPVSMALLIGANTLSGSGFFLLSWLIVRRLSNA